MQNLADLPWPGSVPQQTMSGHKQAPEAVEYDEDGSLKRSVACEFCHKRKAKCEGDGVTPCPACAGRGLVCVYPPPKKRGPKRGALRALQSRVKDLEHALLRIGGQEAVRSASARSQSGLENPARSTSEAAGAATDARRGTGADAAAAAVLANQLRHGDRPMPMGDGHSPAAGLRPPSLQSLGSHAAAAAHRGHDPGPAPGSGYHGQIPGGHGHGHVYHSQGHHFAAPQNWGAAARPYYRAPVVHVTAPGPADGVQPSGAPPASMYPSMLLQHTRAVAPMAEEARYVRAFFHFINPQTPMVCKESFYRMGMLLSSWEGVEAVCLNETPVCDHRPTAAAGCSALTFVRAADMSAEMVTDVAERIGEELITIGLLDHPGPPDSATGRTYADAEPRPQGPHHRPLTERASLDSAARDPVGTVMAAHRHMPLSRAIARTAAQIASHRASSSRSSRRSFPSDVSVFKHRMACAALQAAVFGIGAQLLDQPERANTYLLRARSAISFGFDQPSVEATSALMCLSYFHMGASAVAGLSMGRCYLALASEMAEFLAPRQPGEDTGLEDIRSMAIDQGIEGVEASPVAGASAPRRNPSVLVVDRYDAVAAAETRRRKRSRDANTPSGASGPSASSGGAAADADAAAATTDAADPDPTQPKRPRRDSASSRSNASDAENSHTGSPVVPGLGAVSAWHTDVGSRLPIRLPGTAGGALMPPDLWVTAWFLNRLTAVSGLRGAYSELRDMERAQAQTPSPASGATGSGVSGAAPAASSSSSSSSSAAAPADGPAPAAGGSVGVSSDDEAAASTATVLRVHPRARVQRALLVVSASVRQRRATSRGRGRSRCTRLFRLLDEAEEALDGGRLGGSMGFTFSVAIRTLRSVTAFTAGDSAAAVAQAQEALALFRNERRIFADYATHRLLVQLLPVLLSCGKVDEAIELVGWLEALAAKWPVAALLLAKTRRRILHAGYGSRLEASLHGQRLVAAGSDPASILAADWSAARGGGSEGTPSAAAAAAAAATAAASGASSRTSMPPPTASSSAFPVPMPPVGTPTSTPGTQPMLGLPSREVSQPPLQPGAEHGLVAAAAFYDPARDSQPPVAAAAARSAWRPLQVPVSQQHPQQGVKAGFKPGLSSDPRVMAAVPQPISTQQGLTGRSNASDPLTGLLHSTRAGMPPTAANGGSTERSLRSAEGGFTGRSISSAHGFGDNRLSSPMHLLSATASGQVMHDSAFGLPGDVAADSPLGRHLANSAMHRPGSAQHPGYGASGFGQPPQGYGVYRAPPGGPPQDSMPGQWVPAHHQAPPRYAPRTASDGRGQPASHSFPFPSPGLMGTPSHMDSMASTPFNAQGYGSLPPDSHDFSLLPNVDAHGPVPFTGASLLSRGPSNSGP